MAKKQSKEQQQLEHKISLVQEYTQLWARLFNFFSDGLGDRQIAPEEEAKFFKLVSDAARKEFRLSYFLKGEFKKGSDIRDFLSKAISLSTIQNMTEGQFNRFQLNWHVIFIALNKCLGRLMQQRPTPKEGEKKGGGAKPRKQPAAAAGARK